MPTVEVLPGRTRRTTATNRAELVFRARDADRLRVELAQARDEIARLRAELAQALERGRGAATLALEEENARLRAQVADLEETKRRLLDRVDELERTGKRQAAPFSKGPPKKDPKRPGRKRGSAYGKRSSRPVPPHVDQVIDVPLPRLCECGGAVEAVSVAEQFQTDLPPIRPVVRKFCVHLGKCRRCGRHVQPHHPLQTSDALGAAAVQLGPNALALATLLQKSFAVSWRKIATLFERAFSFDLAASALCRASLRAADRLVPTYHALVRVVRQRPVNYADETGWKTGGHKRWLWGFTNLRVTVFTIAASRGSDVVLSILGADFAAVLVRDGWAAYVAALEHAIFQTCFFHLLRRAHEILEVARRGEARFAHVVVRLLKGALELRDRRDELTRHGFAVLRGKLEAQADRLLAWNPSYRPNAKLAKHLRNERAHLFTFLYNPLVEPTNWPGEHAMRAGVLARKVSGGTRTDRGSAAHSVLTSVLTTAAQQRRDPLDLLGIVFRAHVPVELTCLTIPDG